jgi:hypothetical protein
MTDDAKEAVLSLLKKMNDVKKKQCFQENSSNNN